MAKYRISIFFLRFCSVHATRFAVSCIIIISGIFLLLFNCILFDVHLFSRQCIGVPKCQILSPQVWPDSINTGIQLWIWYHTWSNQFFYQLSYLWVEFHFYGCVCSLDVMASMKNLTLKVCYPSTPAIHFASYSNIFLTKLR